MRKEKRIAWNYWGFARFSLFGVVQFVTGRISGTVPHRTQSVTGKTNCTLGVRVCMGTNNSRVWHGLKR
jgi:hypothetical protein